MIAVVFGIPGVGKTSIVNEVTQKLGLEYIHPGQFMLEIATKKGIVDHVDKIRKLSLHEQHELQEEMAKTVAKVVEHGPEKNYIIDTHAIVKTPQGYFPGLRNVFFDLLKPDIFFVVESDPERIMHRRAMDDTRVREDDKTLKDIILHIDLTRDFATAYAVKTQANFSVIENVEGDLDKGVDEMAGILGRFIENQ